MLFLVEESDGIGSPLTLTLGGLTVFFMMAVIVQTVKIRQLQKGAARGSFVGTSCLDQVVTNKVFGQ